MPKGVEIHVISNTHWDREWLFDFQETRMMLVEFLDLLLGILDSEPRYRAFLLDSQSVPLEDYLEIRPEARERVVRHVTDGRLWVGLVHLSRGLHREWRVAGEEPALWSSSGG